MQRDSVFLSGRLRGTKNEFPLRAVVCSSQRHIDTSLGLLSVLVTIVLIYSLHRKGDVRAELTLGSTMFKLEAKERAVLKNRRQ